MIKLFEYNTHEVRMSLDDQGNPWFIAKDICSILDIKNTSDALSRVDADDIGTTDTVDSAGKRQSMQTVTEAGLYQLVFQSRKAEAMEFKKWITKEVLPTLRKEGSYSMKKMTPAEMLLAQAQLAVEHEKRLNTVEAELHELKASIETINTDYYTISGYCSLKNLKSIPLAKAQMYGKKCSQLSKELDFAIGSTYDAKYGHINTYHVEVLCQVLGK